jgi:uncharacterized protein
MRNLILSGGVAHDYAATSPLLAASLQKIGISSEIHERFDVVEDGRLHGFDLLTINCVRWTCDQTPAWRDEWHFELSEAARAGFLQFLATGKGLLALHCATICFDDWPEYRQILGGWWEWGHSGHAPYQVHPMHIADASHPITRGMSDFDLMDELYTGPRTVEEPRPLMTADWEGESHPMLWLREYKGAPVCYLAPGHGVETFASPTYETILQRCALWALGRLRMEGRGSGC